MKKILLNLLFILFLFNYDSYCQLSLPEKVNTPPSPQASSLAIYNDVITGNYSGIPDISLPLFDVSTSPQFNLSFKLKYFAGGINSTDQGSLMGINWSLDVGGVITRVKKGRDDLSVFGFYKYSGNYVWSNCTLDSEPDMFYYNVNGFSGKFMILNKSTAPGYEISLIEKANIKIELIESTSDWKVTLPTGDIFYFQEKESTIETYFRQDKDPETESFTSSWFLSKIEPVNGRAIDYEYSTLKKKTFRETFIGSTNVLDHIGTQWPTVQTCNSYRNALSNYMFGTTTGTTIKSYTEQILLKKIKTHFHQIVFIEEKRSDLMLENDGINGFCLRRIQVLNRPSEGGGNFVKVKEFDFIYDYYTDDDIHSYWPENVKKRLRLKECRESGTNYKDRRHIFEYNGNKVSNKKIINAPLGYASNSLNAMLKKITYPNGGFVKFEYETNSLIDMDGLNFTGGVRIKKISQSDGDQENLNIREFTYHGGRFLGRHVPPTMLKLFKSDSHILSGCNSDLDGWPITFHWYIRFDFDLSSFGNTPSNSVYGYDKVSVKHGEGGSLGMTEYEFENNYHQQPIVYPGQIKFFMPVGGGVELSGKIKSITHFRNDDNVFVKQKREEFTYVSTGSITTKAYKKVSGNCYEYHLKSNYWTRNTKKKVINYDSNLSPVNSTEMNYYYENSVHGHITKEEEFNSKGDKLTILYKYPGDESSIVGLSTNELLAINTLKVQHRYNHLLQKSELYNEQLIRDTSINYKEWQTGFVEPYRVKARRGAEDYYTITEFLRYDYIQGNVTEQRDSDGNLEVLIYGYHGRNVIAKIIGTDYVTLNNLRNITNVFEYGSPNSIRIFINYYRNQLINSPVFIYTYTYTELGNLASETGPDGKTTYYEYDHFGRLHLVKDNEGNITKRVCYNYVGQAEDCGTAIIYNNAPITQTFVRNDCQTGFSGNIITYTVPEGRYTAFTQIEADALAQDDMEIQGQAYANAHGICTELSNVIYARLEMDDHDIYMEDYGGIGGYFHIELYSGMYIRFYSDQLCTNPVAITEPLTFHLNNPYVYHTVNGTVLTESEVDLGGFTIPQGTISYYYGIPGWFFYEHLEYDDIPPYGIVSESLESNKYILTFTGQQQNVVVLPPVFLFDLTGYPHYYYK